MTLSKTKLRQLKQLSNKKERNATQLFVAEGPKVVGDLLATHEATTIVATSHWLTANAPRIGSHAEVIEARQEELERLSFMQCPQEVFAVFHQRQCRVSPSEAERGLVLALDGVQDPGNLGTIVRIADWFGIANIVCGEGTADIYNPKTVQSTMGSIARINVDYVDLEQYISRMDSSLPVYGTLLDGQSIYDTDLCAAGLIVMGNEGKGISPRIRSHISVALRIPSFASGSAGGAESLNVAIATAITCSEFRRKNA